MKKIALWILVLASGLIIVGGLLLLLGVQLGCFGNWGFECGYYGDFNWASRVVETIPGVRITDAAMNQDVALEEFTLWLSCGETVQAPIEFAEDAPGRRERDEEELKTFVLSKMAEKERPRETD